MKKTIIALVLVVLFASLCACGGSSDKAPKETDSPLSADECAKALKTTLDKNFGDKYTLEINDNIVSVAITQDGMAAVAAEAKNGGEEFVAAWDDMTESMKTMSESFQKVYASNGHDDVTVMVALLDDTDNEKILLSASGGSLLYDVVTGTDTLGMNS